MKRDDIKASHDEPHPVSDGRPYPGEISIANPNALIASFRVLSDAQPGATIHVVAQATDNRTPALVHYQQMMITVEK
jgi:hypothetical protein